MKTAELEGLALDWAVAKVEGELRPIGDVLLQDGRLYLIEPGNHEQNDVWRNYSPSSSWEQGGPIIERERILVQPEIGKEGAGNAWSAIAIEGFECFGSTPLIAAMRCYVASKFGEEVEIPKELK